MFIKNKERKEYLTGLTVPEGGKEDQVDPIKELKHLALTMVLQRYEGGKDGYQKQRKKEDLTGLTVPEGGKEGQVDPIDL